MKHLNKYNENVVSTEDIIDDCKHILLDMSDDYVKYDIQYTNYTKDLKTRSLFAHQDILDKIEGVIKLTIGDYTRGKAFDPGYYIETLNQLNSYLNSNGYKYFSNGTNYKTWEEKVESIERFKGTSAGKLTLMDIYWVKDINESMKYLIPYNEANEEFPISLNKEDVVSDVKDILLDIKDMGLYTSVDINSFVITICISRLRNVKGFIRSEEEYNTIKDVLQRFKDYAKDKRLKIDNTWLDRLKSNDVDKRSVIDTFNRWMDANRFTLYVTLYPMKGRKPNDFTMKKR